MSTQGRQLLQTILPSNPLLSMKRIILSLCLSLLVFANTQAQSLTHSKDWNTLLGLFEKEDWQAANKLSLTILNKTPKKQRDGADAAKVRYMYIYSEAGLMNIKKATKTEALKKVSGMTGRMVTLPGHPVSLKDDFNSIRKSDHETDSLFVTATNKAATSIFGFEYIILDNKWTKDDLKANAGKIFRISGTLRSIKVEGNMFPRFRILIDHGTAVEQQ